MLYFLGFDVLPPFVAWSVARIDGEQREEYLLAYTERLRQWQTTPPISFPRLEEFDESFQRKLPSA